MKTNRRQFVQALGIGAPLPPGAAAMDHHAKAQSRKPNVIVVMTDDQGYGDTSCHGNLFVKTPQLDRLWAKSVRLTNFHVDPTCSPTRAAVMTNRWRLVGRQLYDLPADPKQQHNVASQHPNVVTRLQQAE